MSTRGSMRHAGSVDPARAQRTNASQWTPITSVCSPSASTAASEAPIQGSRASATREQGEAPRDEEQRAEQARLDPELGVRGLARLRLDARAEGRHAGVARPVALRVAQHRLDPFAEVAQVARRRRLAGAQRVVAHARVPPGVFALDDELGGGEARLGAEVRERLHEGDAARKHDRGGGDRPPAALRVRERDEPDGQRGDRRARVREEQAGREQRREDGEQARSRPRRRGEQRDHEQVRRRERAEEGGDEPPERLLVPRVVDEVLRQAREAGL